MRVDRAREAALDALAACRRNGAWIDGALKQVLKRDGLSGRDAAFASRIAYGVMQSRIYLDRCLARCLTQRPEKLEPLLLDILRVGAYQILFMDKVPVNAAVNEAVEMAKAHKLSRAAGLVNAVLRNVDRRRGEPLAFADELEALSVQTSHPRALVERVVGPGSARRKRKPFSARTMSRFRPPFRPTRSKRPRSGSVPRWRMRA